MKKLIFVLVSVFLFSVCILAQADTVWFFADDNGALIRTEAPGGVVEVITLPSPGNSHAVVHGERVKAEGRQACIGCHNGEGAIVQSDKFICSQYDFQPEGRKVSDGAGGFVSDPVSGKVITSGGGIAVLYEGDVITCKMCHYPHDTRVKVEDWMVHEGCLDCHVRVGSSERR